MTRSILRTLAVAATLSLVGCGDTGTSAAEATVAGTASTAAAPHQGEIPRAFAVCSACHTVTPGTPSRHGPSLHGVIGRKAGTLPGFAYSRAMRESGITWDEAVLDEYLNDPRQHVPGTNMFTPTPDPVQRKAIIEFLSSAGH